MKLAEAMNTYSPALLVLHQLGFQLTVERPRENQKWRTWVARKDDRTFFASDPLVLLGLVSLWQHRGDSWQMKEGENALYDKLISLGDNEV
jgi:hypothetical protein